MQIKLSAFGGEIPRVNKRLLPQNNAQTALNCDLLAGSIKSVFEDDFILSGITPDDRSIFNYNWEFPDVPDKYNWLYWPQDVDVAKSPVVGDQYNRIYYTGLSSARIREVNIRKSEQIYLASAIIRWNQDTPKNFIASRIVGSTVTPLGGRTAVAAPLVTAINIGDSLLDGSVYWTRIPDAVVIDHWAANNLYFLREVIIVPGATLAATTWWIVTTGGISGITQPVFTGAIGATVTDNEAVWTRMENGVLPWVANTAYTSGQAIISSATPATWWIATSNGSTGATQPAFTGAIGSSTTDGSITWKRTFDGVSVEQDYKLGVPKPTGKITVTQVSKTVLSWTPTWTGWWEQPDGTKGVIATSLPVTQVTAGVTYNLAQSAVPAKDATFDVAAKFILNLQANSATGALLGTLIPSISFYTTQSDLYINGAKVSATQSVFTSGTPVNPIVFTMTYDNSGVSQYIQNRSYVYTFVDQIGEEGPPSDPSADIAIAPNSDASLVGMDVVGTVGYNLIVSKRIYRTVTSSTSTQYQFVAEIDIAATAWDTNRTYIIGEVVIGSDTKTYQSIIASNKGNNPVSTSGKWLQLTVANEQFQDNITDAEVGEVIPTIGWNPPPDGLMDLSYLPGGFFAGFIGKTVYFSEPNYPHAWPTSTAINVEDNIVGLGVSENTLAILTDRFPYLCTVQDPTQVYLSKMASPQACVNKRSIVENGGAVIYASQDGICVIENNTVIVSTLGLISKELWYTYRQANQGQDVLDDSVTMCFINDNYIWVNTLNKVFRFRVGDNDIAIVGDSDHFLGYYDDRKIDVTYVILPQQGQDNFGIYRLDESNSYASLTWLSREYVLPMPMKYMTARVTASFYPQPPLGTINLTVYADSNYTTPVVNAVPVLNNKAFRLPLLNRVKFWAVQVDGPAQLVGVSPSLPSPIEITEIILSTNFSEL